MDETNQGSIQQDEIEGFPVLRTNVAGIDLGSESHWVCAPTVDGKGREVREFGATTPELEKMAAWLKVRKVVSVAMESTGVYWIPPQEVLERHGLEVVLVDARELAREPGPDECAGAPGGGRHRGEDGDVHHPGDHSGGAGCRRISQVPGPALPAKRGANRRTIERSLARGPSVQLGASPQDA